MRDIDRLANYFAHRAVRRCPSLDFDDVRQDLLIVAMESRKQYQHDTNLPFSKFVCKRMHWKSNEIMRSHFRRREAENAWAAYAEETVEAPERGYDTLCSEVLNVLDKIREKKNNKCNQDAYKLFVLLTIPERCLDRRRKAVATRKAAAYLGMSATGQARALEEVKKAVSKVIHG